MKKKELEDLLRKEKESRSRDQENRPDQSMNKGPVKLRVEVLVIGNKSYPGKQVLVNSINEVAEKYKLPVIFSTHPRTQNRIKKHNIIFNPLIKNIEPLGFFDYVNLQKNAFCVLSDSGTISEESAMMGFRAVSIRTSTERPEAIDAGSIVLGGIISKDILNSIETCIQTFDKNNWTLPIEYKINDVSQRVIKLIQSYTSIVNRVIWNK